MKLLSIALLAISLSSCHTPHLAGTTYKAVGREQKPAPLPIQNAVLPTFERIELDNGLTLMLCENHNLPLVQVAFATRAGSAVDPIDLPGLANISMSMLDEGAGNLNAMQFADQVALLGTAMSVVAGSDSSTISYPVTTENLAQSLTLLASMILTPTLNQQDFKRVQKASIDDLESSLASPSFAALSKFSEVAYGSKYPYGHLPSGNVQSLKKISLADVKSFFAKNVGVNNSAIILVGDITQEKAKELANSAFAQFTHKVPEAKIFPRLPSPGDMNLVRIDRKNSQQTTLLLGKPLASMKKEPSAAMELLNQILGGAFNSRLNLNLRERKTWTYGVSSQLVAKKGIGPLVISSNIQNPYALQAISEIRKEFVKLKTERIGEDELSLAKNSLSLSLPGQFESNAGRMSKAVELFVYDLPLDYYQQLMLKIPEVTAVDLAEEAQTALNERGWTVVAVGDFEGKEQEIKDLKINMVGSP